MGKWMGTRVARIVRYFGCGVLGWGMGRCVPLGCKQRGHARGVVEGGYCGRPNSVQW